jgi:hypothetical protein
MQQVFAWFATQSFNPPLDVVPWSSIPDEMKKPEYGWTSFSSTRGDPNNNK